MPQQHSWRSLLSPLYAKVFPHQEDASVRWFECKVVSAFLEREEGRRKEEIQRCFLTARKTIL